MPEMTKRSVARAIVGTPIIKIWLSTGRTRNNPGKPMTTKALKTFEPKIFPRAISDFLLMAALTETKSSGKEVPIATAVTAITPVAMFSIADKFTNASMRYFAPKIKKRRPKIKKIKSFAISFGRIDPSFWIFKSLVISFEH